ncbi:MAG: M3 family oligoendopeptidase [Ilumatobacteraceae bacterium]
MSVMSVIDHPLPRWSVADLHASLDARSFTDALDRVGAGITRLQELFDEHGVRATEPREAGAADAAAAEAIIDAYNAASEELATLSAVVYASVATDSGDEHAQALWSRVTVLGSQLRPLTARLADWVHGLGVESLAARSTAVREHRGPLQRLAERADHQMRETDEDLYAELATTGSSAWSRLHRDVTSQLTGEVRFPDGRVERLAMAAVRGLASSHDAAVRKAAYATEMDAWPTIATPIAAALNAIKGEAGTVNRRRRWGSPLEASLFANSVSRTTFDAMHRAVVDSLPDFRTWMRTKARLHGHDTALAWSDLVAPLPVGSSDVSWDDGVDVVRSAFAIYGPSLAGLVDRAIDERWIDAEPRAGKTGGAFCMSLVDDRSLVLLNWSGSADSMRSTAHELGHAYHNTRLAGRTPLQRRLPMALAETASIFCETLVVEAGLDRLDGTERLAVLDVDLVRSTQVVVDIHSRFLFETEVFARRQHRTLGATELGELMLAAQAEAYGDGLDQATAHPHMWIVKPHYYSSHFYNWPYTYGLLFGLGLFARFREDPDHFRAGYDDLLSRAGMDTAEELGRAFGLDVTDEAFWTASLDVIRSRIADYDRLAAQFEGRGAQAL